MTIEVEGTVQSIVAKNKGWGSTAVMVGVSVITETRDDETDVSWKSSFDLPLNLIPGELKVGATVKSLIEITETVEPVEVEEEEVLVGESGPEELVGEGDIADDVPDPMEA